MSMLYKVFQAFLSLADQPWLPFRIVSIHKIDLATSKSTTLLSYIPVKASGWQASLL